MQKAIIVCLSKQKDEIINLLQLDDYSFEPLLSNEQLYLIGDIEEYQINLLINIIKHYKSILFINGSPNKNGNTVRLTKKFLKDQEFKTLNLVDYKIYSYGQNFEDDQLDEVIEQMKQADTIVIGSPLYWHSMSGAIRNVLDRFYGYVDECLLQGKDMYFVFQGYAPTKEQLAAGEYTMSRFAKLYGMNYKGMIAE